jgi:hypothetical protein
MQETREERGPPTRSRPSEDVLNAIIEALSGMRYGQVTVIVQDGLVIQIDRTERRRFKA